MKTILVTGGAGYIGSHAVQTLLDKKYKVIVVDNLSTGFREAVPSEAIFYNEDISNIDFIESVFKNHNIDLVIHFAARLNVKESVAQPGVYYKNNVYGLLCLLEAMNKNNVKKIVFSSTAAVYGDQTQSRPIVETDPICPLNPYGLSKYFCEQVLMDFKKAFGVEHVILRYFNVAGAIENLRNGQRTKNAYHLVHLAAQTALGFYPSLKVFGTDYPTTDGTCIRDYIHVQDLAEIHELASQYLFNNNESATFNCGYGDGLSVKQVIDSFQSATDQKFTVEYTERRLGDAAFLVCDPTRIKTVLRWQPKRNNIELICKTAFDWEKKYQNLFKK